MAVVIPYVPQTWTDGVSSCNAARNTVHEDGIRDAHYQPAVRAKRTSGLSVSSSTWTLVTLNSEDFDTAGSAASTMHDNSTNSARLTCRYAGKYLVVCNLEFSFNATGTRIAQVQKNSESLPLASWEMKRAEAANAADVHMISGSALVDLAVNDYVACVVWQNSGSPLDITASSHFEMVRVA